MPRCLLVMPQSFYGFAATIANGLEALGYTVTRANDEYPANIFGKIMGKLDLPPVRWLTRRAFRARFLGGPRWDLVVICKGRGIGAALAGDLKHHADRVVGYHFDALAYDPATARWGAAADRVTTFDYRDAAVHGWPVVELFSSLPAPEPLPPLRYKVSAIVRNHSQRLAYVDSIVSALGDADNFVFIYEKSRIAFWGKALLAPRLYWKWRHRIGFTPLPYADYVNVLAASAFTLDYAHPKQTGVTIRCFEALAVGARIITNNPQTLNSPYFGEHNTVVFGHTGDPAALTHAIAGFGGAARPLQARRTPQTFLAEVVGDVFSSAGPPASPVDFPRPTASEAAQMQP
ncbi:MAG: hypothetical protein H7267_11465 [Sandarakinorhabdus sp.]|nr:hypothetical protein [Sandarakinorhabdus sp.]